MAFMIMALLGVVTWKTLPGDLCSESNEALKVGLSRAVAAYPHLETTGAAVLQIKLTRYSCGGLVIGLAFHHKVRDGTALDDFLSTWAMVVHQGTDFTVPSPFLDRGILTAVDPTTPVFDHGSIEFKGPSAALVRMCNRKTIKLSFTSQFMAELKARVGAPCTTFQCMLAYMLKKTTQARGVKPEEFTQVRVAINCRAVRLVRQHGVVGISQASGPGRLELRLRPRGLRHP
ncbi:hypothetical protein ACQ4PT_040760 [Festuca glaucescens]